MNMEPMNGKHKIMDFSQFGINYIARLGKVLEHFDFKAFERVVGAILDAYVRKANIFVMGNGGSGATASHLVCDFNKGCCLDLSHKFKMICLNDNMPTVLALANDLSYESVFEEQLKNFFNPGDLVIGISGSGNSENVLRAVRYAVSGGGVTMGWSGFGGGELARIVDVALVAESHDMQQVEDVHVILTHMLMQAVYAALHDGCGSPVCDPGVGATDRRR